MGKARLFLENFLVYGLGGIIKSIIPLIMIPVITRLMPNSTYFGINDLSNTIVSFGTAVAIMGMYDAMFRMYFDQEDARFKKSVCSTALLSVCVSSVVVVGAVISGRFFLASRVFKDVSLSYVVILSACAILTGSTNGIIAAPTRMENKRKIFLVTNTMGPLLSYTVAVALLLRGYYTIALPLAAVVSGLILEIAFFVMNRSWFGLRYVDRALIRPMLSIALPLVPNFLIYWVFNSCDKLMIASLMTVADEGIYSVGAKLGMASQLIYTAFAGGWQYFAFSTMRDEDQVRTNSRIFEYLGVISFAATMFICVIARPLYQLLFVGEYVSGFIVSPYLFLAPLLLMLYQVEGNQLIVIKKTWPMPLILASGAVANILLNLYLIPRMGIEGAAIATLVGYVVSITICTVVLIYMKQMVISYAFVLSCVVMLLFLLVWRLCLQGRLLLQILVVLTALFGLSTLYRNELRRIINAIRTKKKSRL